MIDQLHPSHVSKQNEATLETTMGRFFSPLPFFFASVLQSCRSQALTQQGRKRGDLDHPLQQHWGFGCFRNIHQSLAIIVLLGFSLSGIFIVSSSNV